ncbi:DUF2357 domain-containing protein [Archangium primigenium]|uniref:DUF2357 domain-containing protein n=1 Tax=[Archangium] primigenium TaxID=2792470 RepID=UPI00195C3BBB|nr:DUF2357 domain-containing protein [Archangium primigenium]MBM7115743.1 DUF2357 domain-containing protein [Archangium primigenium]
MSTAATSPGVGEPDPDELERRASEVRRGGADALGARWAALVLAEHVIATAAELDVSTGRPLATPLLQALARLREDTREGRWPLPRDGLARMVGLAVEALERIVASPRWRPQRTRVRLQPEKVRQQDVKCLTWLARQPGVTLQEKSVSARQVLGVVRERNHDTPENRLVQRVLLGLDRLVRKRLEACHQKEFDLLVPALEEELRRLRRLVRRELEASPLAGVVPSLRPEPNNVLLGDPDYSRAWRAFRWQGSRDAQAARILRQQDARLSAALGALVLATMAGRKDVVLENVLVGAELEGLPGSGFGLSIPKTPLLAAPSAGRVGLLLFEARSAEGWHLEQRLFAGEAILEQVDVRAFTLSATFQEDAEPLPGRGLPGRVLLRAEGHEESLEFLADAEGLRSVGRVLSERWLGPEADASAVLLLPREGMPRREGARWVGWDVSTPTLQVASGLDASSHRGLSLVGRQRSDGRWFVGSEGLSLLGAAPSLGGPEVLARLTRVGTEPALQEQARTVMSTLFRAALEAGNGPGVGGSLAIAVPDGTDELGLSLLREALPASQLGALFVPSSVAMALEWRRGRGSPPVDKSEPVIVLNSQAPGLTVTYLELLRDKEADKAEEPFVWQRALPFEALDEAHGVSALAWERMLAREAVVRASGGSLEDPLLRRSAERLVEGGLLSALLEDPAGRPVLVPLGEEGRGWLRLERHHVEPAAAVPIWLDAFRRWLDAFERSGGGERLRAQVNGRPFTFLLAGAPFDQAALRDGARAELTRYYAPKHVEVLEGGAGALARGAREALTRRARGVPTWSDTLPPLRLEIDTERGPEWIDLLDGNRTVRPGERVAVTISQQLVLPSGERRIFFPLSRDRGSDRATAGFVAALEHESFPLTQPVKVRLSVDFHYAQDAFRVHVLPVESAPFTALEFRWEAGTRDAREDICDLAPEVPEGLPWDESDPDVGRLVEAVGRLRERSVKLFRGNVIADVKDPKKRATFLEGVKEVLKCLSDVESGMKGLWCGSRLPGPPVCVTSTLLELLPLLLEFGGLPEEPARGSKKSQPLTKSSLWSDKQVGTELDKLRSAALVTLGLLRGDAPAAVLPELLKRARQEPGAQRLVEAVGRQLSSSNRPVVAEALRWLGAQLEWGDRVRPQSLKLPLWALATGFWSTPSAVSELSAEDTSRLATSCEALLTRIADEWHAERVGADLYTETLAVLLGLLRLRPDTREQRLVAGTPEAERLAIVTERAAAALSRAERPTRFRLKLGDGENFSNVVCNALRGQRRVRVWAFEE